jgi:hypothetical protein
MGSKKTKVATPKRVEVFRRKAQGKTMPRVGTTASVQPGDLLTFNLDQRGLHSRYVAEVHQGHIITEEMGGRYGVVDPPRKVEFKDFFSAERRDGVPVPKDTKKTPKLTKKVSQDTISTKKDTKTVAKHTKTPAPDTKKPKSKPKKKPKRTKKTPPVGLLEFLDGRYKD